MTAFLSRLSLEPVVLHEYAERGQTVIEKLERHSDVMFAIVLLTPDDEGRERIEGHAMQLRARQNVIMELGYFIGKLGRNRVCALHSKSVELPSDFAGVLYIPLDSGSNWKLRVARELEAAGFRIDLRTLISAAVQQPGGADTLPRV